VSSGTLLRLLAVLEDRGKGARDGAGWHACLGALSAHLDGAPPESARAAMDGWKDVRDHYIDAFGPEASTIGPPEGFE
jgi:hypothetical protein